MAGRDIATFAASSEYLPLPLRLLKVRGLIASIAIGIAAGTAGCGGGSAGEQGACSGLTDAELKQWEGIYQLTVHTQNVVACDAEGASVLAADRETLFILRGASALGVTSLWLEHRLFERGRYVPRAFNLRGCLVAPSLGRRSRGIA